MSLMLNMPQESSKGDYQGREGGRVAYNFVSQLELTLSVTAAVERRLSLRLLGSSSQQHAYI